MTSWEKIKPWVEPLLPVAAAAVVVFSFPDWTPAEKMASLFGQKLNDDAASELNGVLYAGLGAYGLLIATRVWTTIRVLWQRFELEASVVDRFEERDSIRIAVGQDAHLDVNIRLVDRGTEDTAYNLLKAMFPDLALEIVWDHEWLEVELDNARVCTPVRDGRTSVNLFKAFKAGGGDARLGLVITARDEETRSGHVRVQLRTSRRVLFLVLVRFLRLIRRDLRSMELRLDNSR